MEINKIYNEDCLEGMKRIADGSIDMVLKETQVRLMRKYRRALKVLQEDG